MFSFYKYKNEYLNIKLIFKINISNFLSLRIFNMKTKFCFILYSLVYKFLLVNHRDIFLGFSEKVPVKSEWRKRVNLLWRHFRWHKVTQMFS